MKPPACLAGVRGVVFDTMVLIYLLEDHPAYAAVCEKLFAWAESGAFTGAISPVTMDELIVKPLRAARADLADRYQAALRNLPNVPLCCFSANAKGFGKTWRLCALAGERAGYEF